MWAKPTDIERRGATAPQLASLLRRWQDLIERSTVPAVAIFLVLTTAGCTAHAVLYLMQG